MGYLVSGLAFAAWAATTGASESSLGTTAAGLVGLWAGLGAVMVAAARRKGHGRLALDFGLMFRWPADLVGIAIGVLSQLLLIPLLTLPMYWLVRDADDRLNAPAEELNAQAGDDIAFFVLAVLLIVGAPVIEELFYRGLLLRSLVRRFGSRFAIVSSGLLFGAAHVQSNWLDWVVALPALSGFGIVLGIVAHRAGRLGPAIVAHAAFNGVTVAVLYADRL